MELNVVQLPEGDYDAIVAKRLATVVVYNNEVYYGT
jgi:hypothetical protein